MNGGQHNDTRAGVEARQDPVPGGPNLELPVMFLHIPRTGGFTLKTVLETVFGMRNSLLDIHHYPLDVDPRPFAFIEGHVVRDRFSRVFGDGWHQNGLTLLRDPVARVVSQARHIRALRRDPWYPMLASTVDDAEAFFQKVPLLINLQTKQLGGRLPREVNVPASAVEHATSVLDRLAFGLTEQFDTSMALFAERFGLDLPDFGVTNAAPEKGDDDLRSQEFRDAARVYNDRDVELYRYACDLFARRVAEYAQRLLALPMDEGRIEYVLHAGTKRVGDAFVVRRGQQSTKVRGYVLIDGLRADAVLVRVGDQTTPLACRVASMSAAIKSHEAVNRHAGVRGKVALPRSARQLELIAFDRTRGLRAQATIKIRRDT
jgi:hypothetical protein